ncbi:MAG: LacI family transcriptional regulator [Oscillospiraceae bacterium]|jgi:DNA-binding LacI/PurR family transcriptional regulator|nr:LacI family transcriptional regulator [Oscillospiraceae bacterium]
MATSKDVAKLAGVSHTTVSRAFRPGSVIKRDTYVRIMSAAEALGYTPNTIAASLRSRRTRTVGLVLSHPYVQLFMELAQALDAQLRGYGYRMLITFHHDDPIQQRAALRGMADARVDSVVYMPTGDYIPPDELKWMRGSGVQFLQMVGRESGAFSSFQFDDIAGTIAGMRCVLGRGHRRVLMLGGVNRVEGYLSAYREIGEEPPIPYQSLEGLSMDELRGAIRGLITARNPSAIFSVSDQMGILTYGELSALRLRVPEDVSLLVFDDTLWASSLGISVVGHPVLGMAKAIARQIADYAGDSDARQLPGSMVFTPFVKSRQSIAELAPRDC